MTRTTTFIIALSLLRSIACAQVYPAQGYRSRSLPKVSAIPRNFDPRKTYLSGHNFFFSTGLFNDNAEMRIHTGGMIAMPDTSLYRVLPWLRSVKEHWAATGTPGVVGVQKFKNGITLGVRFKPVNENFQTLGIRSFTKHYAGYLAPDTSEVTVIAMGINAGNVKDYRYHVIADDSAEIVPWATPVLEQKYGADKPYGLIGHFHAPGKILVIEVMNIRNYQDRDGLAIDRRIHRRPQVIRLEATAYGSGFAITKGHTMGYAKKFDPVTGLPTDLLLHANSITRFNFSFEEHDAYPYRIYLEKDSAGRRKLLSYGDIDGNSYSLPLVNYDIPGSYKVIIQPGRDSAQAIVLPYRIIPRVLDITTASTKYLIPLVIGIFFLLVAWYIYHRNKLIKARQQQAVAVVKLDSVRSQLNPHFLFNALTSIQNLVNQHDIEGANHYLGKFANLTRQVLKASATEMISLEDELKIMADYLQMEQLRFGFEYSITADPVINKANTEVPAMLLQPFMENAAKHGVSGLQGRGRIDVKISRYGYDLIMSVADNGPGFGSMPVSENGFGLKLSEERIDLLNSTHKDQHIEMQISGNSGTGAMVTITLRNWF